LCLKVQRNLPKLQFSRHNASLDNTERDFHRRFAFGIDDLADKLELK